MACIYNPWEPLTVFFSRRHACDAEKTVNKLVSSLGTQIILWIHSVCKQKQTKNISASNPFKAQRGLGYLTEEEKIKTDSLIASSVLYDADQVQSLICFNKIKENTECIFAKKAKLWGSCDFQTSMSLERNIDRIVPAFYKFTLAFQALALDAFVIELPGKLCGSDLQTFQDTVRRVLLTLREADLIRHRSQFNEQSKVLDPADVENRKRYLLGPEVSSHWGRPNWVFEFNKVTFFITTFAPFYPECNSRYSFGSEECYILFQPELSFAIHDLPPDTAETNWIKPVTVRDKIRVAFRAAGREYLPPLLTRLPMVYDIVKPVYADDSVREWWKIPS